MSDRQQDPERRAGRPDALVASAHGDCGKDVPHGTCPQPAEATAREGTMNEHVTGTDRSATVLAASVVVVVDGRVLLVRRANEPGAGLWSVPGGSVDPGETLQEAAAREALEEAGLEVAVGRELWVLTVPKGDGQQYEIHDFAATVTGGSLRAGDDATAVGWFSLDEMENMQLTDDLLGYLQRARVI